MGDTMTGRLILILALTTTLAVRAIMATETRAHGVPDPAHAERDTSAREGTVLAIRAASSMAIPETYPAVTG